MNEIDADGWVGLEQTAARALERMVDAAPDIVAAFAVLLIGWMLARIVSGALRKLADSVNTLLARLLRDGATTGARLSPLAMAVIAETAFWIVLFLATVLAARTAGLALVSDWLLGLAVHIPDLIAGALIVLFGYGASQYVGRLADASGPRGQERLLLARIAQVLILATAVIIALDQFGIQVAFLITLLTVVAGALVAGFALAFGLGAQAHVRNLIGARALRPSLSLGMRARIGDVEGAVLELTATHIVLDTDQGRTLVPAHLAATRIVDLLAPEGGVDDD